MGSVESSLYTAAVTLWLFSAGILGRRTDRTGRPAAWIVWFLIVVSAGFAFELLMAHPAVPWKGLWLGLRLGGSLLIAPCLWLAVRERVDGVRPPLSALGRRHLLAIVIGLACTLPVIATAHRGLDYPDPQHPVGLWHSRFIHATMLGCIGIFAVQVPTLLWECRRRLLASAAHARSPVQLHLLLTVVATTWALGLLRTLQCAAHAPHEIVLACAVTEVGVAVGAVFLLVRRAAVAAAAPLPVEKFPTPLAPAPVVPAASLPPAPSSPPRREILAPPPPALPPALDRPEIPAGSVERPAFTPAALEVPAPSPLALPPAPASTPAPVKAEKYARSALDRATRERIRRKIERAFSQSGMHRDSLLSLQTLSRAINEKPHYVSQVFNQDLGTTFYDYVSSRRIETAQTLLLTEPARGVLEIALAVGFNSKSTFNAAFRRRTGVTPSEFRAARGRIAEKK